MKKLMSVLLVASLLCMVPVGTMPAFANEEKPQLTLYSDSVRPEIFVEADCPETDTFAAAVISDYFNRMTGYKPNVTVGDYSGKTGYIAIGSPQFVSLDTPAVNGYIIKSDSKGVRIARAGNKGAARGAYRFLEKYCDCHWYAGDCIVVPNKDIISVPTDIDINYKPFFEYGECDTNSSRVPEFNVANGGSGGVYCAVPEVMGGTVSYISSFCHTLATQFCSADTYFKTHPEYFALHNGKRSSQQLCLTNPDTYNIVLNEVKSLLNSKYDPNAPLQIISLTQNDSGAEGDYCECPACKALDDQNGSHAGSMINFVNKIAAEVKKMNYDNVAIDTFAYRYTRTCPTSIKPLDNVIVRLCSIECCFGHPICDKSCKQNVEFMSDLEKWGKICDRVYVWDYVNNYNQTTSIFANFGVLQSNVQTFYENGVKGVYEEGNYYIANCDSEFGELKTYLLTRLIDNPYCDLDAETDGFLKAYYGPGWENIKEFIGIITKHAATPLRHLGIYQNAEISLPGMSIFEIRKCNKLWQNAKEMGGTQLQQNRVKRSEISWRVWKAFNKKCEFSRLRFFYYWMKANDDLYNDMKNAGVIMLGEGGESRILSDIEVLHYIYVPGCWSKNYENRSICKYNDTAVKIFNYFDRLLGEK